MTVTEQYSIRSNMKPLVKNCLSLLGLTPACLSTDNMFNLMMKKFVKNNEENIINISNNIHLTPHLSENFD
jgi:hypothetical protein